MPLSRARSPRVYRVYGLSLRSDRSLPCSEGKGPSLAAVELFYAPADLLSDASCEVARRSAGKAWFQYGRLPDGSDYLRWSGLFEFLISANGHRIACHPLNGSSQEAFHAYLLGQVLSFALIRQGIEPLHSTTVVIGEDAVGFVGDCGSGKSSLAAAFLQAGHPLLTDDLLVVKGDTQGFTAYPGLPRIKLYPHMARRLLVERATGTPMNDQTPKLVIPLGPRMFWRDTPPLRALYVLRPPRQTSGKGRITIRSLPLRRAFVELLRNSFNALIVEPARLQRQLDLTARLVSKIPVKSLSFPRSLTRLPAVREAILSDLMA